MKLGHLLVIAGFAIPSLAAAQVRPGLLGHPAVHEIHRIQVVNRSYGPVLLSRDRGTTWTKVGTVLRPNAGIVHRVQEKEFTASDWAPLSSVAATAVNAIHLKFDQEKHAGVLTLQPREFLDDAKAKNAASYMAQDASIYLDVPAGHGIFAEDAPFVGNPLELVTATGAIPIAKNFVPRPGDILQIRVLEPVHLPERIEFENKFAGDVLMYDRDGTPRRIATVLRPFMGIGRFTGTQYAKPGVVRANHPGVLCISTAPTGQIGGFQIVPSEHASHPDLDYVRAKAVWMVLGPPGALQQDLEGTYPIFRGYFRPVRSRVRVRLDGGPWTELPVLAGLKEGALKKVTHLAVYPLSIVFEHASLIAILLIFVAGGLAMFTRRLPSLLVLPGMALAISVVALIRWDHHVPLVGHIGLAGLARGTNALGREAGLVAAALGALAALIWMACREGYLANPVAGRAIALLVPAGALMLELGRRGTPAVFELSRGGQLVLGSYALAVTALCVRALGGADRSGGWPDRISGVAAGLGAALLASRLLAPWAAHWYYGGELAPVKAAFFGFASDVDWIFAKVVQEGSTKMALNGAMFIFGSMLAVFLQRTGLAGEIVKTAAELGGDRPRVLATMMLLVVTALFTTLVGLGSIVLVGTIVLPLLLGLEAAPESAAVVLLMGVSLGGILNPANWGLYLESFALPPATIVRFSLPLCGLGLLTALAFIWREFPHVPDSAAAGKRSRTVWSDDARAKHPAWTLVTQSVLNMFVAQPNGLRPVMVLTPLLPLILILGFGVAPVAAFVIALLSGVALFAGPRRADLLVGVAVEGLSAVAPALLILMGLGMLLNSLMAPVVSLAKVPGAPAAVSAIMAPAVRALVPATPLGYVVVFTLLAPLALYRGPLNIWGMGLGLAQVIRSAGTLGPPLVMGMLQSVGQVQGICDPTNTANIWIAGHARITTRRILIKTLPYAVVLAAAGLTLATVVFPTEFSPALQGH